ncbi:MAG TPA: S41 family peptidase [Gemmatimonadales bacterium]|nr:S41 family peptidase [Gemmatimonadales bacterium]
MPFPRTPWLLVWFPALLAAQRPGASTGAAAGTAVDRQRVAAGFWAEARYNYAYWDAVRANWDSAFAATLSYVGERPAPTDVQFVRRLRRWGALLNDGQCELLPPPSIAGRVARPPLGLKSIERRPFIMDYASNDEMRVARPERLAEILAVQGVPAADWIRDSVLPEISAGTALSRWERAVARMLEGERGTALHLLLRLPGGEERGASVTRSVPLTARWPLEPPAFEADTLPDGAIWIRISSFAGADVPERFARALGGAAREGPRHRGLILDLRETTWTAGGRENGYAILARVIEKPFLTSRWRTPQYRPAYRGADSPDSSGAWLQAPSDTIWPLARRDGIPYTGPVAVLVSARTAGPAEDFLVAFRTGNRGVIIGESSAGSTGQTTVVPLPMSWQLRVTVTRDAFPDGREFAQTGIAPDFQVEAQVNDVLAGRDAVLERARAYLTELARR